MKSKLVSQSQLEDWLECCIDLRLSDPVKAMSYSGRILSQGDKTSELYNNALYFHAFCQVISGNYDAALVDITQTLNDAKKYRFDFNLPRIHNLMGFIAQGKGQFGLALDCFEISLDVAQTIGDTSRLLAPMVNMALIYLDLDNIEAVEEKMAEIDNLSVDISDDNQIEIYLIQARVKIHRLQLLDAEKIITTATNLANAIDYTYAILRCYDVLGRLRRIQARFTEAETLLRLVTDSDEISLLGTDAVESFIELSKLLGSQQDYQEAINVLKKGVNLEFLDKHSPQRIKLLEQLGYMYELTGQTKDQANTLKMVLDIERKSGSRAASQLIATRNIKRDHQNAKFQQQLSEQENKALKASKSRLQFLNDVAHQLSSTLDFKVLGSRLYKILEEQSGIHIISLATVDSENETLNFEFAIDHNTFTYCENISFAQKESNMLRAVETKKTVVIQGQNSKQVNVPLTGDTSKPPPQSLIFFPLIQEDKAIGVFSIQSPLPDFFKHEDILLFEAITQFITIATSNIQSHNAVNHLNKILFAEKKEIETAHQRIEHMAYHDALTSLPNRQALDLFVDERLQLHATSNKCFHLIYIDLDGFKPVNDQHGHKTGDLVLVEISRRITQSLREHDFASRVGGDEFILIVDQFTETSTLERFLKRLLTVIEEPIKIEQKHISVSASIGAANYPIQGNDLDTLMHSADQAMYTVKRKGKGGFLLPSES
jgi:diguanylate cyclase (GGDEF)-like protein